MPFRNWFKTDHIHEDLMFMPLSALTGAGLNTRVPKKTCPWYDGPSLLEYLDDMKTLERKLKAPFMMPIISKYRVYCCSQISSVPVRLSNSAYLTSVHCRIWELLLKAKLNPGLS